MPRDVTTAVRAGAFSDSFGGVTLAAAPCAVCGGDIAVNGGGCLKCLLGAALEEDGRAAGTDSLEAVLAEIDLPDTDWRLGNYQILEEIGRGGMGVIYRARQRHSKRVVALKRVLSYHGDSRETLERFRREAEAAASLDHPNILPIYEVGEADGLPFFTMKLATGGSLHRAAAALSAEPRKCVSLLAKVARAIAYAHGRGILHRDLKPGNILLDAAGEPLVSDFGLAKWMDANTDLTRSLAIFGTPGFIAPEQAGGPSAALTPAADVYSLGAILFDLLTGRPPFLGEHAISVIRQAAETPAPRLRSINGSLDRDLETICAKCLEREPHARYRAAADLAQDLERWLEGRPIVARRVSPPAKLWRWSKRNPVLAGIAVVCLLTGALAVTRQIDTWRLQKEAAAQSAAQHSVQIIPFFDLDSVAFVDDSAAEIAAHLGPALELNGPARVVHVTTATPEAARVALSGTFRRVNGRTRISVRAWHPQSGADVMQQVLEVDDRADAATRIAATISTALYQRLDLPDAALITAREESDPGWQNKSAREFIIAGRELIEHRTLQSLERAAGCFQQAIAIAPQSAAAHAELARASALQVAFTSDTTALETAEVAARRSIELDPTSVIGHSTLARVLHSRGRLEEAMEEGMRSLESGRLDSRAANLAGFLENMAGRPDKAIRWFAVASSAEVRPAENENLTADAWTELLEDERAETAYRRFWQLNPEKAEGWIGICRLRLLQRKFDEARTLLRENTARYGGAAFVGQLAAQVEFYSRNFDEAERLYRELAARDPDGGGSFYGAISYPSALGRLRIAAGDHEGGRAILEQAVDKELATLAAAPKHPDTHYRLAALYASMDAIDAALAQLAAAEAAGWLDHRSLALDPRFDAIRDHPSYHEILRRMEQRVAALPRPDLHKETTNETERNNNEKLD